MVQETRADRLTENLSASFLMKWTWWLVRQNDTFRGISCEIVNCQFITRAVYLMWFLSCTYTSYICSTWPTSFALTNRTTTMGRGPHLRRRPPLPPPCWSDKERGVCLSRGAKMKHPGAPRSALQRMAAMVLTSPAVSVASHMMTATWSAVTSAGNPQPVYVSFSTSLFILCSKFKAEVWGNSWLRNLGVILVPGST